jgi:hypothetical protein
MDQTTIALYKANANHIVGTWHSEHINEILVFSFLYDYTNTADLLIINGSNYIKTAYRLEVRTGHGWTLLIWNEKLLTAETYSIVQLSSDVLVIKGFKEKPRIYSRKIDAAFVNSVLRLVD